MKERDLGLDLVRSVAIFFVISVHFFLNNGYYKHAMIGEGMFASTFIRWIFFSCVPLFLLLTGYLKRNKQINKKYYKGIIYILLSYIFISFICLLYQKFYLGEEITLLTSIIKIGNFTADSYSWYIEMYIGLFLLIPFLNILYDNIKTKKHKKFLIITLILMVSISPLINFIKVGDYNLEIIPNYWNITYPILYYFIGNYIGEYKPALNKLKWFIILVLLLLLETILTYVYCYNEVFSWNFLGGYNSLFTVIISTIIFLLLYNIKGRNKVIKKIASSISKSALDMYLFSWIVDKTIYPFVLKYIHEPLDYLKYYFITVLIVFSSAFILSQIKKLIFFIIEFIISYIKRKLIHN